jgi:hypothetical protein
VPNVIASHSEDMSGHGVASARVQIGQDSENESRWGNTQNLRISRDPSSREQAREGVNSAEFSEQINCGTSDESALASEMFQRNED